MDIVALGLQVAGCMLSWWIPFLGMPVSVAGLVVGVRAKKRAPEGQGKLGLALCWAGFALNVCVGALYFVQ